MMSSCYIGKGLYTYSEAARIVSAPTATVRRWAEGYRYTSRAGETKYAEPVLQSRQCPELREIGAITFVELMEVALASHFRMHGLSLQAIRGAARWLSSRLQHGHPLATQCLRTDGVRLFADLTGNPLGDADGEALYFEIPAVQRAMGFVEQYFLPNVVYGADLMAQSFWPLGRERAVVIDPLRQFGKPIVASRAVPTHVIYQTHLAEGDTHRVAWWYGVNDADVCDAVEFEKGLVA